MEPTEVSREGQVLREGAVLEATRTYRTQDLFLFSAATWNPHRVHYDQRYTREVEGHDALLVQGPLQAVHLFQVLRDVLVDGARLTSVSYRHLAALHVDVPVVIGGRLQTADAATATVEMWMELSDSGERTTAGTAVVSLPVSGTR